MVVSTDVSSLLVPTATGGDARLSHPFDIAHFDIAHFDIAHFDIAHFDIAHKAPVRYRV